MLSTEERKYGQTYCRTLIIGAELIGSVGRVGGPNRDVNLLMLLDLKNQSGVILDSSPAPNGLEKPRPLESSNQS